MNDCGMRGWDPDAYLRFDRERTRPAVDLVARIELSEPVRIIDLGCGPGNSTRILAERWPGSAVRGLDSSEEMLRRAREDHPGLEWVHGRAEDLGFGSGYSLVFSNAALQWMGDHGTLVPRLWGTVGEGGAFAAQIPAFERMPFLDAAREVMGGGRWRGRVRRDFWEEKKLNPIGFYYDLLAPLAAEVVLWETRYIHVLDSAEAVMAFLRTAALKPYLDQLEDGAERGMFEADVLEACRKRYPARGDGKVLFPFERQFIIAYRGRS
ncbi:MAG: methyltransferase domain-containing protein [Deltaproteobacteria bacterium]|jgi:trans-aconitate 2-methyltransferase|nr:methyltransferase domain-containing protein [Deltaproteobacteria bacterium]